MGYNQRGYSLEEDAHIPFHWLLWREVVEVKIKDNRLDPLEKSGQYEGEGYVPKYRGNQIQTVTLDYDLIKERIGE